MTQSPLNINLIIPFNNNKERGLDLYVDNLVRFRENLESRVDELKCELGTIFGEDFELTIAARSDGTVKKFFWRFTSSLRNRKYHRLVNSDVSKYLSEFALAQIEWVTSVERELVYINANMKLIKGMLDSINQSRVDIGALDNLFIEGVDENTALTQ